MPELILLDHVLEGGETGLSFIPRLKQVAAHVPIVMISGTLAIAEQLKALSGPNAAHYVIEKPVDLDQLEKTVATALPGLRFGRGRGRSPVAGTRRTHRIRRP